MDGKSLIGSSGYFINGGNGFRWNDSSDAYNNVIMYDNGNMYVRGNTGLGTTSPVAKLDIQTSRSGSITSETPTALYVTGTTSDAAYTAIASFRHGNQSQGISLCYQGIKASGFNTDQELRLAGGGSCY